MNKKLLIELHGELRANYRNQWSEDADRLYGRVLNELLTQIGPARLITAVRSCILHETFLDVVKLRSHIPPSDSTNSKRCRDCAHSEGWLYVDRHHVKRCTHAGAQ